MCGKQAQGVPRPVMTKALSKGGKTAVSRLSFPFRCHSIAGFRLNFAGQLCQRQAEGLGQRQRRFQGGALPTPLQHADEGPVQSGRLGEIFLADSLFVSQPPDHPAHPGGRINRQTLNALCGYALGWRQL